MFDFAFQKNKLGVEETYEHMFFSVFSIILDTILNDYDVYLVKFRHELCGLLLVTEHYAKYVIGCTAPFNAMKLF
jgi:hypothetical protein